MSRILCAATAALFLMAVRMPAHHSFASEYDENKRVTISGTVTEFKWSNPHAWLYVEGTDEAGKSAKWNFELGSPNGLIRRGWKKLELKKGDHVTVTGFGAKDADNIANAGIVIMPDGRQLFGGFQTTPGPRPK